MVDVRQESGSCLIHPTTNPLQGFKYSIRADVNGTEELVCEMPRMAFDRMVTLHQK
jgi:hypothetical protein